MLAKHFRLKDMFRFLARVTSAWTFPPVLRCSTHVTKGIHTIYSHRFFLIFLSYFADRNVEAYHHTCVFAAAILPDILAILGKTYGLPPHSVERIKHGTPSCKVDSFLPSMNKSAFESL